MEHCTRAQACVTEQGLEPVQALQPVCERLAQLQTVIRTRLRDALVQLCCCSSSSSEGDGPAPPLEDASSAATPLLHSVDLAEFCTAYQTRIEQDIRMTVRTTVTECYNGKNTTATTTTATNSSMATFLTCWDLVVEQVVPMVAHIQRVDAWVREKKEEGIPSVLTAACDMICKSMGELLRMRKQQQQQQQQTNINGNTDSTTTLHDMKAIWTRCMSVIQQLEPYTSTSTDTAPNNNNNNKYTTILKSTLLAQTKAFLERQHETHMSRLAAALDAERWVACDVAPARQDAVTRLCTGRTLLLESTTTNTNAPSVPYMQVANGTRYKVVWSCLLVLEMVVSNVAAASHFGLWTHPKKVADLLRLFHTRATHLVLGAGAMHAHAKLRSINAKHLSLVTQSVDLVLELVPHIRGALQQQTSPQQQQLIRATLDPIRIEYLDHTEKVLNKLVSIIGGLVERELSKRIAGTDFDARATAAAATNGSMCPFLDDITSHTRRMHQVIKAILRPDHLQDTFSKIFAFLDTKVPALLVAAADGIFTSPPRQGNNNNSPQQQQRRTASSFAFPTTQAGKRQLLLEVDTMTQQLNALEGVRPWDFTATQALEKTLQYEDPARAPAATRGEEEHDTEEAETETPPTSITTPEVAPLRSPDSNSPTATDSGPDTLSADNSAEPPAGTHSTVSACMAKQPDDDRADSVVSTTTTVTSTVDPGEEEQRRDQDDEDACDKDTTAHPQPFGGVGEPGQLPHGNSLAQQDSNSSP